MTKAQQINGMTIDEDVRLYERADPFEIIDDERKHRRPPVTIHNLIVRFLFRILDHFCIANQLGEVLQETAFALTYNTNWLKGSHMPDIMFIAQARWQDYGATTEGGVHKPIILVPDLVIEVVSPNDLYADLKRKVEKYLQDGVRLIWVVGPMQKSVGVYTGEHFVAHKGDITLKAAEMLPGLQIELNELFRSVQEDQN